MSKQQLSKEQLFVQILEEYERDPKGAMKQLVEAFDLNDSKSYSSQLEKQLNRKLTNHEKAKIEFAERSNTLWESLIEIRKMFRW